MAVTNFSTNGYYSAGVLVLDDLPGDIENYRKFKLVNARGETFHLTNKNYRHFLNTPTGLGFNKTISGSRVGNRYKISRREFKLPEVNGEIVFYGDRNETKYDEYASFVKFVSYNPLKLFYYIPGNDKALEEANSIYMDCEVIQTSKSEISYQDGCLRVPVVFQGLSFWLSGYESHLNIDPSTTNGGQFTFDGPLDWAKSKGLPNVPYNSRQDFKNLGLAFPFSFGADPLRSIILPNKGTLPTPVKLLIEGKCTDPYIRFYDEDYKEYAACKFTGTYDYVYVNSSDNAEEINLKQDGILLGNPADRQDLSVGNPDDEDFFLTFLKIRPGSTHATINLGNNFEGKVDIIWRDEYVSL